ncbi:MAG: DUF4349 domain-containing protein [Dehalococcoidia bacterium]|nr:DUF4349 domain-containing protein [Dehalococcoidia bacterium]
MSKKALQRVLLAFIALYLIIFAGRAVYEFTASGDNNTDYWRGYFWGSMYYNYATVALPSSDSLILVEQKYELIADITSKTSNFDSDMNLLNEVLDEHSAIVQKEDRSGLSGRRRVELVIGVRPEKFDVVRDEILQIGRITSSSITKIDMTYEYLQMLAEREALESHLEKYKKLQAQSSSVSELLQLEEKIFNVETQILQKLVDIGRYSDENALCTITFSLYEGTGASAMVKLWNALRWSTATFAIIIAVLMLTVCSAFALVWCGPYIKKKLVKNSGSAKPEHIGKE